MTAYAYRAVHTSGRIQKGQMIAANENELTFYLKQLDLELIEAKTQKPSLTSRLNLSRTPGIQLQDKITLCRQMEDLLKAGIPFADALDMVTEAMSKNALQEHLITITGSIRAGESASEAFEKAGNLFDPVFLAILNAGEESGNLAETFTRLADMLRWQKEVRVHLKKAVRYPLFLFCVALSVTSFMMGFVVPEIVQFLQSLGTELPFFTKLLIFSASALADIWWQAPLLIGGGLLLLMTARRFSENIKERTDGMLLRVPGFGPVLRKMALTRFITSLALLLKSGLPLQTSLKKAQDSLGNLYLIKRCEEATTHIANGHALSTATTTLFPALILQMIKVGEISGHMDKTLHDIGRLYEQETKESIARFLGMLEPALTLFVGALLAWVVMAVLGPVYGSLNSLAGGM